jgi:hypothetical protein
MDKYQQEEHGHDAVEEQVAWHTIGIVSGSGDQKWQGSEQAAQSHGMADTSS